MVKFWKASRGAPNNGLNVLRYTATINLASNNTEHGQEGSSHMHLTCFSEGQGHNSV